MMRNKSLIPTTHNTLRTLRLAMAAMAAAGLTACSTTSALPEGEQLFTGLKPIKYTDYEPCDHAEETKEEMESVLASAPNGALFGSSYYRTPFQLKLWIWNAFSQSASPISQWITKAFGTKPKLMSEVNPTLRTSVAENHLKKYGYLNGRVSSQEITGHNHKKAKVAYTVDMGPLWRIDSVSYIGYAAKADSMIRATQAQALTRRGDPFSVARLDGERQRVSTLLRTHGYYYYQPGYATYLADTVSHRQRADIRLVLPDSTDSRVMRQWTIGRIGIDFRREYGDQLRDSLAFGHFTLRFNGRRPPVRAGVVLRDLKLRSGQLYSSTDEAASTQAIQNTGLFSYSNLKFSPRQGDTLDVQLDLITDRPYDFYIEANAKGKTTGRIGPELVAGLVKRNAFRGGERIEVNLHGSYEMQTGHSSEGSSTGIKSYEYGGDVSLVFPRLLTPRSLFASRRKLWQRPPRYYRYGIPTTTVKASSNVLHRGGYFKRHVLSGELTYTYYSSPQSRHSFSPLILSYEYMQHQTEAFSQLLKDNPYLSVSMRDQFVPKAQYTYSYTSPSDKRHPINWDLTVSEAGNVMAGAYAVCGEKWSERGKTMFKNPFAQFFKVQTDLVKRWRMADKSTLVGHVAAGAIFSYGNAQSAPYYEQFYVGGANSVRAFNVRSIGPGRYHPANSKLSYIEQTGDVKLLANLEYRQQLWGSLYGALFIDAGNVWALRDSEERPGSKFEFKNCLQQVAVGTGAGLRYDVGIFVLRVDWGIGLHVPYDTGRSGFYNIRHFSDAQSLHVAVGYPF